MKLKNKKLYLIILTFIFVVIVTYAFLVTKIEAPNVPPEILAQQKIEEQNKVANEETYTIINRSTIAPTNILNKNKIVLLTIDDGPSSRTIQIIDILKKHNAKAIFFINGMHDSANIGVIEQTAKEGFAVGNHTWDHLNLKKEKDVTIIEKEINKNGELINKLTGAFPRFFRAPYGESNTYIRKLVKDSGMIFMDWSGAAKDWEKSTVEKDIFISNVTSNLHSGSIILIHEHPWSVANLDALLTTLESDGYTYVDPKNIIE
ncbi:MAG: polysaccharide deacetylase family protein [Candidatus Nomurabacteria bacterium]|nr:polysaccharide deacetylase family protein [Candidatus Nomurabacteria bacterium]